MFKARAMYKIDSYCEECRLQKGHTFNCSRIDRKGLIKHCQALYEDIQTNIKKQKKLKEQLVFWHGKYMIVKHENNKLRNNFYKKIKEVS